MKAYHERTHQEKLIPLKSVGVRPALQQENHKGHFRFAQETLLSVDLRLGLP